MAGAVAAEQHGQHGRRRSRLRVGGDVEKLSRAVSARYSTFVSASLARSTAMSASIAARPSLTSARSVACRASSDSTDMLSATPSGDRDARAMRSLRWTMSLSTEATLVNSVSVIESCWDRRENSAGSSAARSARIASS